MYLKSLVVCLIVVFGVGCAHRREQERAEQRRQEPQGRQAPVVRGDASRADWTKLGERWVDGVRDRDVIPVGARDGTFRRIMIVVEHSALEMYDVMIHFSDGSHFSPPTRLVFSPNTRSQIVDLPGNRRAIRSVEFKYGNLPGGGRAQAELWAQ